VTTLPRWTEALLVCLLYPAAFLAVDAIRHVAEWRKNR